MRHVDADYYGYRDEDDGILIPLEAKYEKEIRRKLLSEKKSASKSSHSLIGLKDVSFHYVFCKKYH